MRKGRTLLWVVIALVVIIIALLGFWLVPMWTSSYSAVYLTTGDLYFGKLTTFPSMRLSDAWYLQRGQQEDSLSLSQFSKAAWGPAGDIKLESRNVVWTAQISQASQILPALRGLQIIPQGQQIPQQSPVVIPDGDVTSNE